MKIDKRQHTRIKTRIEADIHLDDGEVELFQLIDISKGGVSFCSKRVFLEGQEVRLSLDDYNFLMEVLEGDLDWSEDQRVSYKVRCRFFEIMSQDQWDNVSKLLFYVE